MAKGIGRVEVTTVALGGALVAGIWWLMNAQSAQAATVPQNAVGIAPGPQFAEDLTGFPPGTVNTNFQPQASADLTYGPTSPTIPTTPNGSGAYIPLFGFISFPNFGGS